MKTFFKLLVFLAALAAGGSGQAQIIVYDSFQGYATGNLIGQTVSGTTGLTGSWTDVTATNITYAVANTTAMTYTGGDITIDGGSQYGVATATGAGAAASVANIQLSSGLAVAGGTKYFSFLMRYGGALNAGDQFAFNTALANNNTTSIMRSGVRENTGSFGFVANDSSTTYTSAVSAITNYFVVVKLEQAGANWGNASMWVNPTSTITDNNGGAANAVRAIGGTSTINYMGFKFQSADIGDSFALDEIRIGATWADVVVVPEPATWVLLAGVGTFFMITRRRWS
jgi:hypothetical protein